MKIELVIEDGYFAKEPEFWQNLFKWRKSVSVLAVVELSFTVVAIFPNVETQLTYARTAQRSALYGGGTRKTQNLTIPKRCL